jgi:hypothetical protein
LNYSLISKTAAGTLLIAALTACGGGGGDPAPVAAAPAPTSFTVAGTAATGAVFANATITVIGSDGTTYPAAGETAIVTGADGSYTITLPLTANPPFVVQAVRDDKTLISVVAEAKNSTTNITPVTNLIASRLSTSGDPAKLADEIKANPALVDATKLTAKVAEVVALIKPLMDAVGDSTDPLNGKIVADGTGADKVLDSLSISITPDSATTVAIEVAVKQQIPENTSPVVIAFTNTTAPAAAIAAVKATDLVPSGTAPLIADFLQRMTACYALALTDRVNASAAAATDIIAPACKTLFSGDDPTTYKHNGGIVSSKQAFSGIFASTGTGVKFDRGTYEFTRGNGDLVIAFRSTDTSGNSQNQTLAVTNTAGKLKAIGNQYKYGGGVNAYQQLRTFVNQPAASYYSTGYNFSVNNVIDPKTSKSIYAKVVVTTPKGGTLTLVPSAGYPTLQLAKNGISTGTSFVRIRSVYADATNSGNPANTDTTLFFATPAATDADIAGYAAQSSWQFDYYLVGAATPDATQYYKTRARAMTIAELQTRPLAALTDADISYITTNTPKTGHKVVPTPATGPITLHWTVPARAMAPTSIQVWGDVTISGTTTNWSDNSTVPSTAVTGDITCSATGTDPHCSGSNYVAGDGYNGAHLWASDPAGREFASFYAFYTVTIVP